MGVTRKVSALVMDDTSRRTSDSGYSVPFGRREQPLPRLMDVSVLSTPSLTDEEEQRAKKVGSYEPSVPPESFTDRASKSLLRTAKNQFDKFDGPEISIIDDVYSALEKIIEDDQPTPQVRAEPSGIEIEWLVGGESLFTFFSDDNSLMIYILDKDGNETLSRDFDTFDIPDDFLEVVKNNLSRMGKMVKVRMPRM